MDKSVARSDERKRTVPRKRWWQHLARPQIWLVTAFFAFPAGGAVLSFLTSYVDGQGQIADGLEGASHVAISPDGRHLYAAGALDDALVVFTRDATNHVLTYVEVLQDQVGGVFGLNGASGVATSGDGRHVYVSGHGDDAVAVFARDATLDHLTFIETQEDGFGGVDGLEGASSVIVSPDDQRVYVTGRDDSAISVFSRDATQDGLTFETSFSDGAGADGLGGASCVATTPNGEFIYVAGREDDAVAVFRQVAGPGGFTYVGAVFDGVDGANGLAGASSVAVSPDGRHLYVAARMEDSVGVFDLPASGIPVFVERQRDGRNGVFGLNEPVSVVVSSSGRLVFVASRLSEAVVIFGRNPTSGALRFLGVQTNGANGVSGLGAASSVALSADDRVLYATGRGDDALTLFLNDSLFLDGFESGDSSTWTVTVP